MFDGLFCDINSLDVMKKIKSVFNGENAHVFPENG